MYSTLSFLGIYDNAIEKAYRRAEEICDQFGVADKFGDLNDDDFHDELKNTFTWDDPTNSIILAIFTIAERVIRNADESIELDWCIDGDCSSIYAMQ